MKKKLIMRIGIFVFAFVFLYSKVGKLENTQSISKVPLNKTIIDSVQIIELPDIYDEYEGFTCTGLTYDVETDSFWIGNYGKLFPNEKSATPSLINVSSDFKKILRIISIKNDRADIQGVSYDNETNTLWYSDGIDVVNCDLDGDVIQKIDLGKYKKYKPNGVVYDSEKSTLWVLCFYKYLLKYNQDGKLINVYDSDYIAQDHLAIDKNGKLYFSVGNDYHGNNNYIVSYSMDTMKIDNKIQLQNSYSIEGICFVGERLYVTNDGLYHNAKINKNLVIEYNLSAN